VHCSDTESWPGDGKATHAGQSGTAATRGNVNLDNTLEREMMMMMMMMMMVQEKIWRRRVPK